MRRFLPVIMAALLPCFSHAAQITHNEVPYATGMWPLAGDPFGFSVLSNLVSSMSSVTNTPNDLASHTNDSSIHTTGQQLLNVSNVLAAADAVTLTGKLSMAAWEAGSNSFATAAQGQKADTALQPAHTNGWTTAAHQAWLTAETDTLQSVVTRGGTVTSGTVTIDATGTETNTYGGLVSILGNAVKSQYATLASGDYGATALGHATKANGNYGATALGHATKANGNYGATALGNITTASGMFGATALGAYTTASGSDGATALGHATKASGVFGATALGAYTTASGSDGATALGTRCISSNASSFVWSSFYNMAIYGSHGDYTFNIDPANGLSGVWVGEDTLQHIVDTQFVKSAGGTITNATLSGNVTIGGETRTNWPTSVAIIINTTNNLPTVENRTNGVIYVEIP